MKRNKFSLSHYKLLSARMGYLVPLTWYETLPGDTIQHSTAMLIRMAPLVAPLLHPVKVRIHHWFVPNRLIWDDFEDFITGGEDGTETPTHPYITFEDDESDHEGYLFDHLGVPPVDYDTYNINVSALPFRAYGLIYNEFYRDQQLGSERDLDTASGADTTTEAGGLSMVSWEKDYFTTCRPYADLGNSVTIPVETDGTVVTVQDSVSSSLGNWQSDITTGNMLSSVAPGSKKNLYFDNTGLQVDIDDLRLAMSLKRFQEVRNKYGADYSEYLRYLGVRSSDARLQKPEYLGGGVAPISFSPIVNVGQQDESNDIGDMKGAGIGAVKTRRCRRFFEEHGIFMTLMSVIPKSVYGSACERAFWRQDKEDYYNKELEMLGEQGVYRRELQSNHSTGSTVFGYQHRYDEYRSKQSTIAGEFRSTNTDWHLARTFTSNPTLNASFTNCLPDSTVFANSSNDQMYIMASHSIQARRMLTRQRLSRTI
jgi:hypothetical protein